METNGEYLDKWIESIPENPYGFCPCGCGMKWKFTKGERAKHEETFIKKLALEHKNDIINI